MFKFNFNSYFADQYLLISLDIAIDLLIMDKFEIPTAEQQLGGEALVGKKISIYWDGDAAFYPCQVTKYDAVRDKYQVLYENDSSGIAYDENLSKSVWKIWTGTDEEYLNMINTVSSKYSMKTGIIWSF